MNRRKKQGISWLLALVLMLGICVVPAYAVTNRIEAESGTVVDANGVTASGTFIQNVAPYNGREGIGLLLKNAANTAKTSIAIGYTANGSHGAFDIYVGDSDTAYSLPFYSTASASMRGGTVVSGCLDIPGGADIRIVPSGNVSIDYIETGDETALPVVPTKASIRRIEVETGYIIDPATNNRITDHLPRTDAAASGGKFYGNLDNMNRAIVLRNDTGKDKSGILIRYVSNNSNGIFHIYINGEKRARQLAFPNCGGWPFTNNARMVWAVPIFPRARPLPFCRVWVPILIILN